LWGGKKKKKRGETEGKEGVNRPWGGGELAIGRKKEGAEGGRGGVSVGGVQKKEQLTRTCGGEEREKEWKDPAQA